MLEYYTGVPGSGKTYRAVDHAYNCFLDDKHKDFGKYKRLYTNINEFHFEYFNKKNDPASSGATNKPTLLGFFSSNKRDNKDQFAKVSASESNQLSDQSDGGKRELTTSENALGRDDDLAISLRMDELLTDLEELRQLYLAKNPDTVLVSRAAELRLSDSLFIIDEAHNFFDDKNDTLIWWLSYHRHLHQDIILITQNLSLIYRKYLSFGEFFYRAVPSSLRIRSGVFTYHQFIKYQLYKNSHTDTIKVNFNKDVFALYGSGANTQGKKVIYKFIIIAVVLAVLVTLGFNFFTGSLSSSDSNTTASSKQKTNVVPFVPVDRSSTFTVVCVGFECSLLGQNFSLQDFNQYAKTYSLQSVDTTMSSDGVYLRSFARNDKFFKEVLNVTPDSSAAH